MSDQQDLTWREATDLGGKLAVLTGIASGIGRAAALQFASAGATVVGGDVNEAGAKQTADEIAARGGKAAALALDLTKPDSIDRFTAAVVKDHGVPDVIANIAGWDKVGPFLENTPEVWNTMVHLNYVGPVRLIHNLLPALVERKAGGRIVTVASDAGRVGSSGETFYAGTKGAIIAFTKSLAREMARHRINCNVVCPGPTDTPLFNSIDNEKLKAALIGAIPLRRLARPSEIAHSIVFLCTPAAGFITGQVLSVSGGLTMHG
jgi:2-hydroxycyclohexanecarboxyl-CoA dehydrogenase